MRAVLFALLVVLAFTVSVSASSADWAAPEALWSSDLSVAELEARHNEFLMAVDGSSSSGPSNFTAQSSSSAATGAVFDSEQILVDLACIKTNDLNVTNRCTFNETDLANVVAGVFNFPLYVNESFSSEFKSAVIDVPVPSSSAAFVPSSSAAAAAAASSSGVSAVAAGRRLLAATMGTKAELTFVGSPVDGGENARTVYAAVVKSLQCQPSATETVQQCQDRVTSSYGFTRKLSESPAFQALAAVIVPGSIVADTAAVNGAQPLVNSNQFAYVGGPRDTNGGYYFLGALLLLFIVIALVYFIVHKAPIATHLNKEEPRRDEVALAPVVAAPAAGQGVVVAEEAPLAGQQQMDYRSVFALKHNVLDKSAEQKAAEADEHNHNDVHFILHQ